MNNRNILKAYALLQQMTPDEHALLNLLRSLSEAEREQLIEVMGGGGPSSKKKAGKKGSKSSSKSSRASGMAAAIAKNLNRPREGACAHVLENGATCNTGDNNPIHDQSFGYAGYHEFQSAPVAHEAGAGG